MFQENIKRIIIDMCIVFAILLSIYYLATTHVEFMISYFHFRLLNVSAISYTLMRCLYLMLPLLLLVPNNRHGLPKIKRLKYLFYAFSILYLLGSTWLIHYLADNPISSFADFEYTYSYLQGNALVFDYLVWDVYDPWGVLFSFVQAIIYFLLGHYISKSKTKTVILFWISLALSVLLPFLYIYLISSREFFTSMWLQKNVVLFASGLLIATGLTIARSSSGLWGDVVWH